jgi:hypothetical protein
MGGEVLQWSYYDTIALLSTTQVFRMFTTGLSGAKRLDQTNLSIGGQLPANQKMHIHAIKPFYVTAAAKATAAVQKWYNWLTTTTIEFKIEGKASLFTTTLDELFGMTTKFALTPTAAGDNILFNTPKYSGIYPIKPKIVLAENTVFEVTVTSQVASDASLDGDLFKIGLCGILERRS